jgi:hypothetical protein
MLPGPFGTEITFGRVEDLSSATAGRARAERIRMSMRAHHGGARHGNSEPTPEQVVIGQSSSSVSLHD